MWIWGRGDTGCIGDGAGVNRSSPVQLPGTTWSKLDGGYYAYYIATKTDGTLWSWGYNGWGNLGHNNRSNLNTATQIPGTNWSDCSAGAQLGVAVKTDGTLWSWGYNQNGNLGLNQSYTPSKKAWSSPVQIPGTNWSKVAAFKGPDGGAIATQ